MMSEETLWKLRQEIKLGSLFVSFMRMWMENLLQRMSK